MSVTFGRGGYPKTHDTITIYTNTPKNGVHRFSDTGKQECLEEPLDGLPLLIEIPQKLKKFTNQDWEFVPHNMFYIGTIGRFELTTVNSFGYTIHATVYVTCEKKLLEDIDNVLRPTKGSTGKNTAPKDNGRPHARRKTKTRMEEPGLFGTL